MEDPLNQSAPESTGERVNKSARLPSNLLTARDASALISEQMRSLLGVTDPTSALLTAQKNLLSELAPAPRVSDLIIASLRPALDVYARPSEQWLSALNAYPLDTGTGFQKSLNDLLGVRSGFTDLADSMIAARSNSLSMLGGVQNSKSALGSMDAALAAVSRSMAPAIEIAVLQKSMDGLLGRPSTYSVFANSMASLQSMLGGVDPVSARIAAIRHSIALVAPPVAFPRFVDPFAPLVEEIEEAGYILDKSDYYFWRTWPLGAILRIFRLDLTSQSDAVVVTNILLDITSSDEFAKNLESIFLNSPILKRRWPNIADSLRVHRSGIFSQTIRNLLAELEGILGDVLVEEGIALDEEGKIYRMRDSQKQKELKGLGQIAGQAQHSELQEYEDFQKFRKYAEKKLAPKSHPTRHGRVIDFHTADLSARLILYIHGLAVTISRHLKGK